MTGEQLGARYRTYKQPENGKTRHARVRLRHDVLDPEVRQRPMGGLRCCTQAIIADAHHRAFADAIDFLEREVVATRAGAKGPRGSVVQLDATGVVAAGFDHYDSPRLHTHVV